MARPARFTWEDIRRLRSLGWTFTDIAHHYDFTKQAVSQRWRSDPKHDAWSTKQEWVRNNLPWDATGFSASHIDRCLRNHGAYMMTEHGEGIGVKDLRYLYTFYRTLIDENAIVEFDPAIPAGEADSVGGYRFVPRLPEDGELVIRCNAFVNMGDVHSVIWRMPTELPETYRNATTGA